MAFRKKTGETTSLMVSMYTLEITNELYLLGQVIDISEHKRSELANAIESKKSDKFLRVVRDSIRILDEDHKLLDAKLAKVDKKFKYFYDDAPFGCHFTDLNGVFQWVNATELAWLGHRRDEVVGKMKFSDFFTPAYKALFTEDLSDSIEFGNTINKEYDLICKGGKIKRVILNVTDAKVRDSNFLGNRTIVHDITELKIAQNRLKRIIIKQQMILDNQLVGSITTRDRHIIHWGNKGIKRIFGYESEELNGKSIRILYPDESSYLTMAEDAYPIIKNHGIYRTQLEMMKKHGEKIWMDVSGILLNEKDILWMFTDISILKRQQEQIESIAYHDVLTGLPNRFLVSDRLTQALAQAKRENELLAVCYLDLDGFKPINDTYGHAAGDKLLIEITRRMQDSVRINDTVGRLGGDEFVLLLSNLTDVMEFQIVLERVLEAINIPIALDKSCEVTVGVSIGVSLFPRDSEDPDILLRYADHAMYQAKKEGRNRVHLFCADNYSD